tara:strand:- start:130 stop:261 length:132 start_codon:yes stop_codon:yes gene_type:complete
LEEEAVAVVIHPPGQGDLAVAEMEPLAAQHLLELPILVAEEAV